MDGTLYRTDFRFCGTAAFCNSQHFNKNNYRIQCSSLKGTDHLKIKTHPPRVVPNLYAVVIKWRMFEESSCYD